MKELQKIRPADELKIQRQVDKEYKLVARLQKIKGLKLWSITERGDYDDDDLVEVIPVRKEILLLTGGTKTTLKTKFIPGRIYVQALNRSNAMRKVKKIKANLNK